MSFEVEVQARQWIEKVLGEPLPEGDLHTVLKDGIILCNLVNTLKPGICRQPKKSTMPFKQMENINSYLQSCTALHVPPYDLFQTVELFEAKNMKAVLTNIHSLGRCMQKIPGYSGPTLGAKMATSRRVTFTEKQLAEARAAPKLLTGLGSHGGATQSGISDTARCITRNIAGTEGLGSGGEITMALKGSRSYAQQNLGSDTDRGIIRGAAPVSTTSSVASDLAPRQREEAPSQREEAPSQREESGESVISPAAATSSAAATAPTIFDQQATVIPNSSESVKDQARRGWVSQDDQPRQHSMLSISMSEEELLRALGEDSGAEVEGEVNSACSDMVETEARDWITALVGELPQGSIHAVLKDGVVLCNLANKIQPGVCTKPTTSKMPFKQMENINAYLQACSKLGVPAFDLFQTVELYEAKNIKAVLTNIHSLGRCAQKLPGYSGPTLGAKMATANLRTFTDEQLREARAAPTLFGKGSHTSAQRHSAAIMGQGSHLPESSRVEAEMAEDEGTGVTEEAVVEEMEKVQIREGARALKE